MKSILILSMFLAHSACHQSTFEERVVSGMMKKLSEEPTKTNFEDQMLACVNPAEFFARHPNVEHQCRDITMPAVFKIARQIELEKPGNGCGNIRTALVVMKKNEKWAYERCCSGAMKNNGDCKDIANFTTFYDPDAKLAQ